MQPEETQAEQEAEDAFHHATIARAREEVHGKAIPERRGEGRILVLPSPHRDSGEDLVSKSSRQGEANAGSGDREVADVGGQAAPHHSLRLPSGPFDACEPLPGRDVVPSRPHAAPPDLLPASVQGMRGRVGDKGQESVANRSAIGCDRFSNTARPQMKGGRQVARSGIVFGYILILDEEERNRRKKYVESL